MKLILTFEKNQTNTNLLKRVKETPDYELELERCVDSWRSNAGPLRNIDIFVHCDEKPSKNIKTVEYFVKPFEKKLKSSYGFVNVHESGLFFHSITKESLLHIDLDMILERPLPNDIFSKDTLGVYSKKDEQVQRQKLFGNFLAETDFIFTTSDFFYKEYYKFYNSIRKIIKCKKLDEYDVEEYTADFILSKYNLNTFQNYEYGEGFLGKPDYPFFKHEHIYKK